MRQRQNYKGSLTKQQLRFGSELWALKSSELYFRRVLCPFEHETNIRCLFVMECLDIWVGWIRGEQQQAGTADCDNNELQWVWQLWPGDALDMKWLSSPAHGFKGSAC